MDSPKHQPYKSRLFNFVNRQSLKWRDRLLLGAQYLRVGVEWSLQILIYPLYIMVQAARATGKKLKFGLQQKLLSSGKDKITASTSKIDQPLKRVFRETEHCLTQHKEDKSKKENKSSSLIMVQGVASEIDTKNLVLVAENNRIINVLSETQQHHLKKYIRLETANYWYDLKQNQRNSSGLIHIFSEQDNHVLPPIRWFWQVMRWMQTGTLAMSLDFFGESSIVPVVSQNTIPSFSSKSLVSLPNTRGQLLISASFSEKIQQLREHIRQKSNQSLNIDTDDPFRLEFLIYAAIDYFFNQVYSSYQLVSSPSPKSLQPSISNHQESDDPWLSPDDLYSDFIPPQKSLSPVFLPQSEHYSHPSQNIPKKRKPHPRKKIKKTTSLSKGKKNKPKTRHITTKSSNAQDFNNNKIDIVSPNWVETEVKNTGYIKHPLVRVLEWLDTAIHWLEELGKKLVKIFKKR